MRGRWDAAILVVTANDHEVSVSEPENIATIRSEFLPAGDLEGR
jgi:hypothetical protein